MLVGKITCGLHFSEINIIKKTAMEKFLQYNNLWRQYEAKSSERMFEFKLLLMVYIIV